MKKEFEITKYDYLDHLRGLAIFGVLYTHLHYLGLPFWTDSIFDKFSAIGRMGVPLFFIVSAYTLSLSHSSRTKKEKKPLTNFYIRRFFRIYPLFFIINILVFFLFSWLTIHQNINLVFDTDIQNLFYHLSFLFGFFPKYIGSMNLGEWSLFNEFIFYLLFPVLFFVTNAKKTRFLIFIAVVSFLLSYRMNIVSKVDDFYYLYRTPLVHLFSFVLGMILFRFREYFLSNRSLNILCGINILSFVVLGWFYLTYGYEYAFPFFILNLGLMVFLFIKKYYFIGNIFIGKFLKFTGIISYSLYLINYWVFLLFAVFFQQVMLPSFGDTLLVEMTLMFLVVSMIFLFSFLSYLGIERSGIYIGKRIIERFSR